MPRRPDPRVEDRILNAALTLFRQGGEKALTMRAVARAAGTNTPTVYRRFKNRRDIVFALSQRVRQELNKALESAQSPVEMCVKYVEFAITHPYEFRLLYGYMPSLSGAIRSHRRSAVRGVPIAELLGKLLAEQRIGSEIERKQLSLSLWALAHGAATLLVSHALSKQRSSELQSAFKAAVDTLLSAARNV